MRIIIWVAAGLSAAALASAAPARPGGSGHGGGGGLKVGWSSGGGQHGGKAAEGWGYGPVRVRPRHGRNHRRFGWDDSHLYGGAGIGGPVGEVNAYGNGFFTGGGGRIRMNGGRPVFDYDRSYPYEFSAARRRAESEPGEEAQAARPGPRCTFENGVRVCRGW
jgi:hypothetical protein